MNQKEIQEFWAANPCGQQLVAETPDAERIERFFDAYDQFRYSRESHILRCLDEIGFEGRDVLEIGLGQGADSEQIIRRGGRWSGVDLTMESVDRVRRRLELRGLPFIELRQGSAIELPFPDSSFDLVYSHGVLHHVPDVDTAQKEIARVLRPGGELITMLYCRDSLNYQLSIRVLRRLGLAMLYALQLTGSGIYAEHLANARRIGLRKYLRLTEFVHRSTDGPGNPYSRVYSIADVSRVFDRFELVRTHKEFMHAPPLPVKWLPLSRLLGWHLWSHMRKRV